MENEEKTQKPHNPRENANFLSILTFAYTIPTFLKGFHKALTEEDIPLILKRHSSKRLGDALEKSWQEECKKEYPSLWRALARVFLMEFVILGLLLFFLEVVLKIIQSLSLARLIAFFTHTGNESVTSSYMHAGIIVVCSYLNVLLGHNYMLLLHVFGMKLRIACCSLIYRKSLRVKKTELGAWSVGEMVNLLSNDVSRCDHAANHAHNLWVCPLETIIIIYILNDRLGFVSVIGILFMISFIPLQLYMGKKNFTFRLRTAFKTDERVRLMNEVITGIQVIKMYAWEQPFTRVVEMVRKLEIHNVQLAAYVKGLLFTFSGFTSKCAMSLTIITHVLFGNTPRAEYVFVVVAFYNILRQAITVHFPGGITELSELKVSITRLRTFLMHEEVDQAMRNQHSVGINCKLEEEEKKASTIHNGSMNDSKICMEHASAQWRKFQTKVLNDINIMLQGKRLTAIIGPVGGGKTSLLQALLRELPLSSGTLRTEGTISYASQDPWVFAGTIQQNILFGESMDLDRYRKVLQVCALERDLNNLPRADKTLVGSRGVALSGGQRARINLARAVYKKADIYLLDDPLSAVDTQVGKHLFSECISTFLGQECVVLVTHQLQFLKHVESIYVLENGTIVTHGSYDDLKSSGVGYTALLETGPILDENESMKKRSFFDNEFLFNEGSANIDKERIQCGSVSTDVYTSYMRAAGSFSRLIFIVLIFILTYAASNGSDYFLTYWVNVEQAKTFPNATGLYVYTYSSNFTRRRCIIVYAILVCLMVVSSLLGTLRFYNFCMQASRSLHNTMLASIVKAPMAFFVRNNSGRILNRFSKDMGMVDDVLPTVALDCVTIAISVLAITSIVCFLNPWMIITTSIIFTFFYLLRIFYLATNRCVKRLEGRTRSPVFAHMSASLEGLTTIRAFGAERILENEFDSLQDLHSAVWYTFLTSSRAFGFWLDMVCVSYIAITTFSFLVRGAEHFGGNVGLAITQAMALTGKFQWGMRQCCEFENLMTCVERVVEYIRIKAEPEAWKLIPSTHWPCVGNIEFRLVSLKYTETEPNVLKQLSFTIFSNEKVGIVGRTGAGKTSLIQALFRLSTISGTILIDGIDISTVPLHNLRTKISIIPQEPVLFSGSLRKNLDPFEEHSDEELWNALEEVELKPLIADLPQGLRFKMAEGGTNFSVGQRQLLCLARASIRKNKILILDEATASLDPKTDALIQKTIRSKFSDCTVLTIAHRLNTIIDSDRVMVIRDGQVVEFDHPYKLLSEKSGVFYSMVEQAGPTSMESFVKITKDNYQHKLG
ncbi:probable multidrug resistance-associated protein lethal(2)03659 [Photinus pyralis]|uniref:probable multidrug resistance-associated protein lethal(2)03659 n=1 Tax=Photinus pyralis TaxID=7054 RepID=UPI00126715B9|nr:probable multidrug resistance-associated protein lethal(2)03659 [Photinus pyralis]